jgi:recombination protein RecA
MTAASDIRDQINKAMGGDVVSLGSEITPMTHWSTGILPIDFMLDGGLPVGRFTEVFGDYSTLKSYMALMAVASVQKAGGRCAYVDSEHSFDQAWAASLGVAVKDLLVQRPQTGEEALMVMELLIRDGYDLVIWDSIAATQPKQYAEKKPGEDLQPGGQARMMSAGLRRLNSANTHTAVLAINQTRMNIGMTYGGTKDTMPGGKAMPFYASYRLRMVKAGKVSEETEVWEGEKLIKAKRQTRQKIKSTLEKSKLSAPNREVWFDYDMQRNCVDEAGFIIGWAIEQGIIETKSGGLYVYDELKVRGREKFVARMEEQTEVMEWMRKQMTEGFSVASHGGTVRGKSKAG